MPSSVEQVRTQIVAALNTIHPSTVIDGVALRSDVKQVNLSLSDLSSMTLFPQIDLLIPEYKVELYSTNGNSLKTTIPFRIGGYCEGATGTTTNNETNVGVEILKLSIDVVTVLRSNWITNIAGSPAWQIDMENGLTPRFWFDWKNNSRKAMFRLDFVVVRVGHCANDL